MSNREKNYLSEYLIAALLGGILTGPGGLFLATFAFFLISRSKGDVIYKSKWVLWAILGILPFIFASYPSFVLSRSDIYAKEVKKALNEEALKCIMFEFDSGRIRSKITTGNALYKTYIPKAENECTMYGFQPRNFKSGLRSFLFWNRNLDATWFQIEIDQKTEEMKKICGDSSKPGCGEGNTW